jgi:hypothetical protein
MNRLRLKSRTLKIFDGLQEPSNFPCLIQCVLHNTRSLLSHLDDIRSDSNLLSADVPIFTKTRLKHLTPPAVYELPNFRSSSEDCSANVRSSNVLVYYRQRNESFLRISVRYVCFPEFTIKYDMLVITTMSDRIHLIALYRSPDLRSLSSSFDELRDLLTVYFCIRSSDASPLIICDDFNVDLLKSVAISDRECSFFSAFSLRQRVQVHTTDYGSLLDQVWTNLSPSQISISMQESFWSDHVPVLFNLTL